jgi:predicted RNA binding protein YcfA (HicA-like mRNA interferase family)
MTQLDKLLDRMLRGTADATIGFADLCQLLRKLGFDERIRGSHHIFTRTDVEEIINLQPKGSKAKVYQVRQVRSLIIRYGLGGDRDEGSDGSSL